MRFNNMLIALALTSTLVACGSDSSTPIVEPPTTPPVVVETTVNGQAVKGVLANAVVTVYKFVDGEPVELDPATELKDGNITTDGSGNYSFIVLDYEGPIKIELSPSTDPENPTTMTCDAPAGCGDTAFGDAINLTESDPNFKLAAISVVDSESAGEVKINVSALTHLASVLIEAEEGGVTADTITEKSTLIASTFGIEGDITQLEATVTTDAAAVAGEDNEDELRLGLINAGIMAAMFSGETDDAAVLSTKLAEVAADLIENDGAFLVNQDEEMAGFELAISDVLAGAGDAAAAAVELIEADETLTGTEEVLADLAQEEVNLENEQAYQEANVGDDGLSEVVVDQPTEGDAVAKAKAMVEDVRLFMHLFDETSTEGTGIKTQGDAYLALMDEASLMIEAEADSFTLLAQVSEALAAITLDLDEGTLDSASSGVLIADYLTADEITGITGDATGTITFDENTSTGGVLFNVNVTAKGGAETATLNASAEFTDDGLSIMVNFAGSIESAGATFTLADSSFAKISFDMVASRDAFDNDTYEGEIVSGELRLDVELAQKASDTVTNPITFTGMLHTKLLPVGERVLSEYWDWDNDSQQDIRKYGRPEIETIILPEMLTLSGEFSSSEGDLIKATLTVNINNLEGYEAPEFKYIGKEIENIVSITFSENLNTIVITDADSISDREQGVETRIFTPGTLMGEWTATNSVVAAYPEEHYWGTGIERKIITKRFDTSLDEQGTLYTRAYIIGDESASFGFKSIRVTPVDYDDNGTTDAYQFDVLGLWDEKDYDGTSFATLMDADGNILTSDGELHPWDTAWFVGEFTSIDEFMEQYGQFIVNPLTVSNGAELLAQTITNWWGNQRDSDIDDIGIATIFFNEDELADIAAGEFTELNPTAYLTKPLIKDAFSIAVSEDSNTVMVDDENTTRTYRVDYTSSGNFVFNREILDADGFAFSDKRTYATEDIGLDVEEVTILRIVTFDNQEFYRFFRITPIDDNNDDLTDYLSRSILSSTYINSEGILTDADGLPLVEVSNYFANSYDEIIYDFWTPFNPFMVTNTLDAYKGWLTNARGSYLNTYIEGIGAVETTLSADEVSSLATNTTTMFDAYNTEADTRDSLEDEDTFLDVNAALTLEAMLGDYQVKIQLSGERTAIEAGIFNLAMSYRLPGDDAQRSFTVHYNTEEEGRLTANNFEGVVLVLEEPDEDATGTQILGHILVGPTAIVAATIEDRGGVIWIVYADIDDDGLQEEESL